jgi:glycosyltransferase involved in cell wall biosynthesis
MCALANAWVERGHQIELVTTHDGGAQPHFQLSPGVRRVSVDSRGTGLARQARIVRSLRACISAHDPDVVISFLNFTNIVTLIACSRLRYPVIVSERLDPRVVDIGPVWTALRRVTYRRAAILVAQTPTAARLFEPLAPGRTHVIPNPVTPPPPAADAPTVPFDSTRPTILAMGRLHEQKGFDLALQAMAEFTRSCPDWRLVILGEGPERQRLEALRSRLGLDAVVLLPGKVADPWPSLRAARIFLMSSRSEGFPNALCEAMSAGLPVVSTDCPSGPSDIITPGVDGLLVPPGDVGAMAAALVQLASSEPLRTGMAEAAPRIVSRYSLESVLAAWDLALAAVGAGRVTAKPTQSDNG